MELQGGGAAAGRARQVTFLARMVVAVAIEQRALRLRWIGAILAVLGVAPLVQGPRWVGVLAIVVGGAIWLAVTSVVRLAVRLLMPPPVRQLRADIDDLTGQVREAARDIGVPVSIPDGLRFAWALARGRRPHARVLADVHSLAAAVEGVVDDETLARVLGGAPPPRTVR